MGASKSLFMDIRIAAEMDEQTFRAIPEELKPDLTIKRIEAVTINGRPAKDVYKEDRYWSELNKELSEIIKLRSNREDEIRVDNR